MAKYVSAKPYYNVTVRLSEDEYIFLKKLDINKSQLVHDTIANMMMGFKEFKEEQGIPLDVLDYKPRDRKQGVKGLPFFMWIKPPDALLDEVFGDDEMAKDKYRHGKGKKKDIDDTFPYHG